MTQIDNWEEQHINKVLQEFEAGTDEKDAHPALLIVKVGFKHFLSQKIKETITLAKEEGVKEERDRWINQPVNQHDEKIRAEERKRIVEIINQYALSFGNSEDDWHAKTVLANLKTFL